MPTTPKLSQLVEEIARLTPTQRRQLLLRLRAAGLFVPGDLQSDRNRLSVATSVKLGHDGRPVAGRQFVAPEPAPPPPTTAKAATPTHTVPTHTVPTQAAPTASAPPQPLSREDLPLNATAEYRSPVAGKVVVAPENSPPHAAHVMPALPGQAPEQPIEIIFDGGSRGNPGQGYGSYHLRWPGAQDQTVRLRFGDKATNNEAEYDTLIAALEGVLKKLTDSHADLKTATLDVRGDSLLVINQVLGKWDVKEERMRVRRDEVRKLLSRFGHAKLTHHDRENSVKTLGH